MSITTDTVFLNNKVHQQALDDLICVYAVELSVIEKLLSMGYTRYKNDKKLVDRQEWLKNEIAHLERTLNSHLQKHGSSFSERKAVRRKKKKLSEED